MCIDYNEPWGKEELGLSKARKEELLGILRDQTQVLGDMRRALDPKRMLLGRNVSEPRRR